MRKPSVSKLKKKAWSAFSKYIRLMYADQYGNVTCVTCGTKKHYKEMQAGHLVPGRRNSILFDERGVYPQCYRCNICLNGNLLNYLDFMESRHGAREARKIIKDLKYKSRTESVSFTADELKEMIKKWEAISG